MKVSELRELTKNCKDDTEVMLYDSDTGEYYSAKEVSMGLVRDTKYKHGGSCLVFDPRREFLSLTEDMMEKYHISEYTISNAVIIQ